MSRTRSTDVTLLGQLRSTLTQNAKYLAVGIGAFALAGGTATTVSLASSGTPSPQSTHASTKAQGATAEAAEKKAEAAEKKAEKQDGENGTRPTDTHGYCVSHAVAAAKAAGKTGRDIAAAAHSCPKPGHSADKGKSGNRGKSSTAPGRTSAP